MEVLHRARSPDYIEGRVEREEGFEQILFAPEAEVLRHELLRVVERREDVMKMDKHTWGELGKDGEAFVNYVAIHRHHMTGVDKKNVIFAQSLKQFEWHILHRTLDQLRQARNTGSYQRNWVWLNADEFRRKPFGSVLSQGRRKQKSSIPSSNLNDPFRLAVSDGCVRDFGVNPLEKTIVEVKLVRVRC
jgi:hypothetical protein